jgi:hypothetical protein
VDHNVVNYTYTPSAHYISQATVTKQDGLTETHTFNADSLHTGVEVKNGTVLVSQGTYLYGTTSSNQMLQIASKDLTYTARGRAYADSQGAYADSSNGLGDVTQITETFPQNTALNSTVTMTYGANSILTGKRYRKDAATEIREEYILDSGGRVVT